MPLGMDTFLTFFSSAFFFDFFLVVLIVSSGSSYCKYGPNLPLFSIISFPLSFSPIDLGSGNAFCSAAFTFDKGLVNLHSG